MEKIFKYILIILCIIPIVYIVLSSKKHVNHGLISDYNFESFANVSSKNNDCPIINGVQTIPDVDGLTSPAKYAKNCYVYPLNPYLRPMGVQLNCKCKFPSNNTTKYPGLCAECYNYTK